MFIPTCIAILIGEVFKPKSQLEHIFSRLPTVPFNMKNLIPALIKYDPILVILFGLSLFFLFTLFCLCLFFHFKFSGGEKSKIEQIESFGSPIFICLTFVGTFYFWWLAISKNAGFFQNALFGFFPWIGVFDHISLPDIYRMELIEFARVHEFSFLLFPRFFRTSR